MTQRINPLPYSAFTLKFSGKANRIIVQVGIAAAFDPNDGNGHQLLNVNALIDTGATNSVISAGTAKNLGLVPVGEIKVSHAGGYSTTSTYLINIMLPNHVGFPGILVSEFADNAGDFQAIIGMDLLMMGDLSLSNVNGKTCISFRIPPFSSHDFVKESIRIQFGNLKSYVPCPCGSKNAQGKPLHFGECHGKLLFEKDS